MSLECPAIRKLLAATTLLMAVSGILCSAPLYSSEHSTAPATAGYARQLGSWFNLPADTLAKLGAVSLFSHTTQPGEDPVTTVASYWLIVPGISGSPQILGPDQAARDTAGTSWQDWTERCEVVSPLLVAAAGNGADDFWGAFELVGAEAKVISHNQSADAAPVSETDIRKK